MGYVHFISGSDNRVLQYLKQAISLKKQHKAAMNQQEYIYFLNERMVIYIRRNMANEAQVYLEKIEWKMKQSDMSECITEITNQA